MTPPRMKSLSLETVESCLRTVAKVSLDNEKFFCDLDGEMGDADFGKTLADGFRAVLRQLDGDIDRSSIGTFLMKVGSAFAGSAGGTTGPMWGTAFLRAGINSKEKQTIDLNDLVLMGRAAIAGMMARGNAVRGDKTLLDALIPAVDQLEEHARTAPKDLLPALQAAASVAEDAIEGTRQWTAKRGRQSYAGDRTVGTLDPGIVAVAMMLKAVAVDVAAQPTH
ncbi:MAG TPA: dihydroxyacetone kinase subunit DhaL [Chthoniobacterales bacterium]|nr:dihydroxyacetone kinase subunit DhaL [Chthoniobacterales bacterium]